MMARIEYIVFPWWPNEKVSWIHPEDVETARSLIPGRRVFCRTRSPSEFETYRYGDLKFRAKPVLHWAVRGCGLQIGDRVEIFSDKLPRPQTATICDMFYDMSRQEIEYRIRNRCIVSTLPFWERELRKLIPPILPQKERIIQIQPPKDQSEYSVALD